MGTAMNIEEYKKLPLEQLRDEYGNCLIKQKYREATVNTSRTDAFYIWRNGSRGLFWQAVEADDKTAENILLGILAKKSSVDPRRNISGYMFHLRLFRSFLNIKPAEIAPAAVPEKRMTNTDSSVPKPSPAQVKHYLDLWDSLENYHLQEDALDRLFFKLAPGNEDVTDILLKASTLNDFYSTNIFSIFPVAKHIQSLHIDERLKAGDTTLVGDIQHLTINGVEKNFYSFATKYCSHHNPLEYPIYDSYVDRVLRHYRDQDGFAEFKNEELKDYARFKELLIQFREFYGLQEYDLKQIDKYIWQLGKDYFPKNYGK